MAWEISSSPTPDSLTPHTSIGFKSTNMTSAEEMLEMASTMFPEDVVEVIESAGFTMNDIEHLTREDVDHEFRRYKFGIRKSLWFFFKTFKKGKRPERSGEWCDTMSQATNFVNIHHSDNEISEQVTTVVMDMAELDPPITGVEEEIPEYQEDEVSVEVSSNDQQQEFVGYSPTRYKLISNSSINGREKLFDDQGYSYSVKKKTRHARYWNCVVRRKGQQACGAAISQIGDRYRRNGSAHTHPPNPGAEVVARITVKAFKQARENPHTPASTIVRELLRQEGIEASSDCPALPQIGSLQRKINRHRQQWYKLVRGKRVARGRKEKIVKRKPGQSSQSVSGTPRQQIKMSPDWGNKRTRPKRSGRYKPARSSR